MYAQKTILNSEKKMITLTFLTKLGPVLDNDLQTSPPPLQGRPTIRFFLAYVSDDFKTKKKYTKTNFFLEKCKKFL